MESRLRKFVWDTYQKYFEKTGEGCDKWSEAKMSFIYPPLPGTEENDFYKPIGISFYSYELGPSREHFFYLKGHESWDKADYNEFTCDDLEKDFKRIVNGWLERSINEADNN